MVINDGRHSISCSEMGVSAAVCIWRSWVADRLVALCRDGVCLGSPAVNDLRLPSVWQHA